MTSFIRRAAIITTTIAVVAAGGVGMAASADAATTATTNSTGTTAGTGSTGTAAGTATAAPTAAAGATATATAAPTSGSATVTATPKPTASPAPTGAPSSTTGSATPTTIGQDPSLAVQNANGDHAMGSTIPVSDAATGNTSLRLHSLATVQATAQAATPSGLSGLDVSAYQPSVNWSQVASQGAKFAYIKATEGTSYASSTFASQYNGAYAAGLTRGAYHFATPATSSGAQQATWFVNHGGNWSSDGRTLPPLLDIEYGYSNMGGTCWGLSQPAMVSWIASFSNTVLQMTGTRPAIYSTTDWWNRCTGNSASFSANPLFIARYTTASSPGTLPASWSNWSIWQWADSGTFPGDQDVFNGSTAALKVFALGTTASNVALPSPTSASTLGTGVNLGSGKAITSSNGQFTLSMQSDGNLVLSGNGHVMWYSRTNGNPGAHLAMQADGNLVIYAANGAAVWASKTFGSGGALTVTSTGQIQVSTNGGVAWTSGWTGTSYLSAGSSLTANQTIHDTTGYIQGYMQIDGNFVVYINQRAKWATNTSSLGVGAKLILQKDGNLVLYSASGRPAWSSHTSGSGAVLNMQADGNLVLTIGGKVRWYSHTSI